MQKVYVHALHKSGSMFLWKFFDQVAKECGLNYYSINNSPPNEEMAFKDKTSSFLVCPLRYFPDQIDNSEDALNIFVVRNPLDILVSQYFSHGWIHPVPPTGDAIANGKREQFIERRKKIQSMTIDEYAEEFKEELYKRYLPITRYADQKNVLIVRYEDMVLNFREWCNAILLPFGMTSDKIEQIYQQFKLEFNEVKELTPTEIKSGMKRHKRKMTPGDHVQKMSSKSIQTLNEYFTSFNDVCEHNTITSNDNQDIDLIEVGTTYGGYVVPSLLNSDSVVYSIGIGEDLSFDTTLQGLYKCNIHLFDPTERAIQHFINIRSDLRNESQLQPDKRFGGGQSNYLDIIRESNCNFDKMFYHPIGISDQDSDEATFYFPANKEHVSCSLQDYDNVNDSTTVSVRRIETIMNELETTSIDLLKLHANGFELEVLKDMFKSNIFPSIIIVKWNCLRKRCSQQELLDYIERMKEFGYFVADETNLKFTFIKLGE